MVGWKEGMVDGQLRTLNWHGFDRAHVASRRSGVDLVARSKDLIAPAGERLRGAGESSLRPADVCARARDPPRGQRAAPSATRSAVRRPEHVYSVVRPPAPATDRRLR